MTPEERQLALETYAAAYNAVHTTMATVPAEALHYRPRPGRWTIHEILIHLADSECNAYIRCRTIVAEPGGKILAYDQDKLATELAYTKQSTEEALELFKLLRSMTVRMLRALPDAAWARTAEHSANGTTSLDDWLSIYAGHIPTHIRQIRENLAAWRAAHHE